MRALHHTICLLMLAVLAACATADAPKPIVIEQHPILPEPDLGAPVQSQSMRLIPTRFTDIEGWADDDQRAALSAFREGCRTITRPELYKPLNVNAPYAGTRADWVRPCDALVRIPEGDPYAARRFFELEFRPYVVEAEGQVTGYYEPMLEARDGPDATFSMPMLAPPADLVTLADAAAPGGKAVGRLINGQLQPYPVRAEIGAQTSQVLAWLRPGDLFFLQIQGSGRLHFPDGREVRAAFAAHNGRPYASIGKVLIERGVMPFSAASASAISNYLDGLPGPDAAALMNLNERYVFFHLKPAHAPGLGPDGGMGVPLTAGRSLAVDPSYHAYGAPIWVSATTPRLAGADASLHRLMVAQDTGGAIKGPARGDIFVGTGLEAGQQAGRYNHAATFIVLIPARLAGRL